MGAASLGSASERVSQGSSMVLACRASGLEPYGFERELFILIMLARRLRSDGSEGRRCESYTWGPETPEARVDNVVTELRVARLASSARAIARLLRIVLRTSARFQNSSSRLRARVHTMSQTMMPARMATPKMPPMTAGTRIFMPALPSSSRHCAWLDAHCPAPREKMPAEASCLARALSGAMSVGVYSPNRYARMEWNAMGKVCEDRRAKQGRKVKRS